jgi:hypothetical protein
MAPLERERRRRRRPDGGGPLARWRGPSCPMAGALLAGALLQVVLRVVHEWQPYNGGRGGANSSFSSSPPDGSSECSGGGHPQPETGSPPLLHPAAGLAPRLFFTLPLDWLPASSSPCRWTGSPPFLHPQAAAGRVLLPLLLRLCKPRELFESVWARFMATVSSPTSRSILILSSAPCISALIWPLLSLSVRMLVDLNDFPARFLEGTVAHSHFPVFRVNVQDTRVRAGHHASASLRCWRDSPADSLEACHISPFSA